MLRVARGVLIGVSSLVVLYALFGALLGKNGDNRKTYRNLGVYSEVLSRIKSDYVTEPNLKQATQGALRGLLESLDPYNTYFTADEYRAYEEAKSKEQGGLELVLWKRFGYAAVISVLPGSEAEQVGIRPGDLIDSVDQVSTRQLSLIQIQQLIAGPKGSLAALSVIRKGRGESRKFTLTRRATQYPSVTTKWVQVGIGYIQIPSLEKNKSQEVRVKLQELLGGGARKLVVDLRDCALGEVFEGAQTANFFLEGGLITYAEGQKYPRKDMVADAGKAFCKLPLALLINGSTAGAAEIMASAILENKRGEVVGERSYGVGSIQGAIPLEDGSALLLSIAKYHSPSGKKIQGEGVKPSVEEAFILEPEASDDKKDPADRPLLRERFGTQDDPQLKKALEVLQESLPKAA